MSSLPAAAPAVAAAAACTLLVTSTRAIFQNGATKSVQFRRKQLENLLKFFEQHESDILAASYADLRKPKTEIKFELLLATNHLRYVLNHLAEWTSRRRRKQAKRLVDTFDGLYVYNDPYGVVLVMGSWNFSLLTLVPIAGAIAAGNCVIIKPSHLAPHISQFLANSLPRYLDPNCYRVFPGDIAATTHLLEQRFDYIYYTGSSTVAKIVHAAANKFLTPTTLELGGKNAVYIDDTADLEKSVRRIMWGKILNAGQACIAPDYVLCTKAVQERFIHYAGKCLREFFGNSNISNSPDYSRIISKHHFDRLTALMKNHTLGLGGGINAQDCLIEPTILIDVKPDSKLMESEIFGPLLPIITVDSVEQAVGIINDQEKALALYIFTNNKTVIDFILNNTSSGGVTVNDTILHLVAESLPFGGVGMSGMGSYKSEMTFDTFVHKKSVLVRNFNTLLDKVYSLRYPPYSDKKMSLMATVLKSRASIVNTRLCWLMLIFILGFFTSFVIFQLILS